MSNIPHNEQLRAYASALLPAHAEESNTATPAPERTTTASTPSLTLTVPLELSIHVGQPRPTAPALLSATSAREPAPEPEATGLAATPPTTQSVLVELTLDDAAEASAEVRRAADELGLLTRGWHVTGPIDTRAPRRCIELLAPADTDMRGGWDVAHALRSRLAARPELAATAEPELALALSGPEAGARGELEGTHDRDHDLAVEPNWHLDGIRARAAWALSRGASVRIGHPDTGTTAHPILAHATILADEGLNLLELDQAPTDPLTGLGQPGHGTATSSLMVSPDGPPDGVSGLAPAAELVPIRVTDSVVILAWQARLARAIDHAVDHGCHVISMSLGGLPGIRLRRAVERAHDRGVIVVAAAGNVVQFVVWPAAYPQVIAVAATGPGDRAWSGSSKGNSVAVTAPGHRIVVADWHRGLAREWPGSGTSYATALVASAAALWLARHGVHELRARYPGPALPQAFRAVLTATATRPLDPGPFPRAWFGSGLLDCEALLRAPLPVLEEAPAPARVPASDELLAALLPLAYAHERRADALEARAQARERSAETAHQRLRSALAEQLPARDHETTAAHADELAQELLHHVAIDPAYREAVVDNLRARTRIPAPPHASAALQRHLAATTSAVIPATQTLRVTIPITIDIRVGAPTRDEPR